jgi:hypothetical protein
MRWIFGYGSLLIAEGINGRNMNYQYSEEDLFEVTLKGFRREWNAVAWNNRFLGLAIDPNSSVNGVVFKIHSEADYLAFLRSECSLPTDPKPAYTLLEVTAQIDSVSDFRAYWSFTHAFTPGDLVYTCVTTSPSYSGTVPKYYKDLIMRALKTRGKQFAKEFFKNTGASAIEYSKNAVDIKNF